MTTRRKSRKPEVSPVSSVPLWTAKPENVARSVEVWQCAAYGLSPYTAAKQFVAHYWDVPRQLAHDCVSVDGLFELVDGRPGTVYSIVYRKGEPLVSVDTYVILRYDAPVEAK